MNGKAIKYKHYVSEGPREKLSPGAGVPARKT